MERVFGLEDLAMERISLQQLRTELNSSNNNLSFFLDKGRKLSFRALITSFSAICTHIRMVAKI